MRRVEIKKQYILGTLIFVIALVTVGFALLQSNLRINGTVTTKSNSWSVYFSNILMNSESVSKTLPTITERTSLNFNVELDKPGDLYGFTVDAVNDGTIDAKIGTVSISNLTTEQAKLIDLSITYENGTLIQENDKLNANTTRRIKVSVKYKEDINPEDLPNSNVSVNIIFTTAYVQSDESAREDELIEQGVNLYNLIESKADKTTLINFSENSSISNTNGIYTTTETDSGNPVYYYRGNVDNNIIFGGYCWNIIRTTETGGVKLIYRGTPTSDGKCNKPNFTAGTEAAQSETLYMSSSSTYYYGSSYTFDENIGYSISGTITSGQWSETFADSVRGMYTCQSTSPTEACATLYKITGYEDESYANYTKFTAQINTDTQVGKSMFNSNEHDDSNHGYLRGNALLGYMYGNPELIVESTTLALWGNTCYGTEYEYDEDADRFSISGKITCGVWSKEFANSVNGAYTCNSSDATSNCRSLKKVAGYLNEGTVFESATGYVYYYSTANYNKAHTNLNNSTIKNYLEGDSTGDGWFKTSGLINFLDKLEDTTFCNDRTPVAPGINNTLPEYYGTLGYGGYNTGYGSAARSSEYTITLSPTLRCVNNVYTGGLTDKESKNNDKFTFSKDNGNGKLRYPVGLITLDEVVFAGINAENSDKNNYLYTGSTYWTISPVRFEDYWGISVGTVSELGHVRRSFVQSNNGVRPVVSLKTDTLVSGTGTPEKPYVVK